MHDPYNGHVMTAKRRGARRPRHTTSPSARLRESERLFADFVALTPYTFKPFVKSFDSYAAYERWKRVQKNPWYR